MRNKCKYTNNDGEGLLSQAKKVLVNKYMHKQAQTHTYMSTHTNMPAQAKHTQRVVAVVVAASWGHS